MNKVRIMENATTQVTQTTTPASPLRQAINWTIQKHNRKFIDEWGLEEVIFRRCDKKVLFGECKIKISLLNCIYRAPSTKQLVGFA